MDNKRKMYLKLNIMSLFFAAVSFMSITLAWFAYSGIVNTETEVNVKAWHIEFDKRDKESNSIVISLTDLYPGMQTVSENVKIKNLGDSDAMISYEVSSIRILNDDLSNKDKAALEDSLAHDYPFAINMSLSDTYANAHDGVSEFNVSVSWPLDNGDDDWDSDWGQKAYEFKDNEAKAYAADNTYLTRSSIRMEISLKAVQYLDDDASSPDPRFKLGDIVLYNYEDNVRCYDTNDTKCMKGYIIDKNSTMGDADVRVLPDLFETYEKGSATDLSSKLSSLTRNWTVTTETLKPNDILDVISKDITGSVLVRPNLSNKIIGTINNEDRMADIKLLATSYQGYFRFKNEVFPYFSSAKCYWLDEYYGKDEDKNDMHYALVKVDDLFAKVYPLKSTTECDMVPVVKISKSKLIDE